MSHQQCRHYVSKVLEELEDGETILMQMDGYESLINAVEDLDTEGQIKELISPGDCTDLCSVIDCEV